VSAEVKAGSARERTFQGTLFALEASLMRNMGVLMTEIAWLDNLAGDGAEDGHHGLLFATGPLKVVGDCGSPVSPTVVR